MIKDMKFENWTPKEEYSRIPFDPNVRHELPKMPNDLQYKFLFGHVPPKEA